MKFCVSMRNYHKAWTLLIKLYDPFQGAASEYNWLQRPL